MPVLCREGKGMTAPLIEVSGLSVAFGGQTVLQEVDLVVEPGRVVTLVGPNGAGKSTLLRAALGLVRPQAGSVRRRPGLTIAYVPQKLNVEPTLPLTVRRFLALAVPGRPAEQALLSALERTGAAPLLERPLQGLSGGEKQRVLLARAILRGADLLVLDEPVAGVDVAGQAELYGQIAALRDQTGCAVLMVSHDLHLVMAATDQVVCLNRHVCCAGPPNTVRANPAWRRLFGDVVPGLAVYTHHHDHHHHADGSVCGGDFCSHAAQKRAAGGGAVPHG